MFDRLSQRLFPPTPEPVFTDPTLGPLSWHPLRESWSAELGVAPVRHRFEIARRKPSPVPPEPALAVAREMVRRLNAILRVARGQIAAAAVKSLPARAAELRALTIGTFHLRVDDDGAVRGYLALTNSGPWSGWSIDIHNGALGSLVQEIA